MIRRKKELTKKITIVGEGETEYYYFDDLKNVKKYDFKLNPDLPKHTKSDYESIFNRAEKLKKDGYDMVFCVIDYDTIAAEKRAKNAKFIQKYNNAKKKLEAIENIFVVETMPCFEYWFLLHYINYSRRVYQTCGEVILSLRKYLPNYDKSEKYLKSAQLFSILEPTLNKAIENAQKLCDDKDNEDASNDVPYSDMPILFSRLDTMQSN